MTRPPHPRQLPSCRRTRDGAASTGAGAPSTRAGAPSTPVASTLQEETPS
ncbi:hypothetical protein OG599_00750 [Streptomyces sp. NBC_01335]|nr:hypothetical protein OG599_00750 [Streptomyces sp. NBC_01335]